MRKYKPTGRYAAHKGRSVKKWKEEVADAANSVRLHASRGVEDLYWKEIFDKDLDQAITGLVSAILRDGVPYTYINTPPSQDTDKNDSDDGECKHNNAFMMPNYNDKMMCHDCESIISVDCEVTHTGAL